MKNSYHDRVELLINILGHIDWEDSFALKGGTAINLFYENMPRLSVDIDLVYLPINSRREALDNIAKNMNILAEKLSSFGFNTTITRGSKLIVSKEDLSIKIETNMVIRGSLYEPQTKLIVKNAIEMFKQEVSVPCLIHKELMASKLVAMMDRQHPRDIFDMKKYVESMNTLEEIRDPFIVYLLQANRPFSELLNPNLKNIERTYQVNFKGMELENTSLNSLHQCREQIFAELPKLLGNSCKELLVSFMEQKPKWELSPFKDLKNYPGIKWKMMNIKSMSNLKIKAEINNIDNVFSQVHKIELKNRRDGHKKGLSR